MAEFSARLEEGHAFEDFVEELFWSHGIAVRLHRSRKYQWERGESASGIEIKLDKRFRETGNLFIETRERRAADGTSQWRPCGIHEEPVAPRTIAIGDYNTVYWLATSWLLKYERAGHPRVKETDTAVGFLVPVTAAEEMAIDVLKQPLAPPGIEC